MRRVALVVGMVVVAGAGAAWLAWRPGGSVPPTSDRVAGVARGTPPGARAAAAPPAALPQPDSPAPGPGGVRRLTSEARARLGARIEAAARRAAAPSPSTGRADEPPVLPEIPLERVAGPLRDALESAIPALADCYPAAARGAVRTAAARMTLITDPDLGTVIDTAAITEGTGGTLPSPIDACLRDAIDTLALPPLGQAGTVKVEYSFRFDDPR